MILIRSEIAFSVLLFILFSGAAVFGDEPDHAAGRFHGGDGDGHTVASIENAQVPLPRGTVIKFVAATCEEDPFYIPTSEAIEQGG